MKLMRTCLLVLSVLAALVAGVDVSSQQSNGQKPQAVQKVTDSSSSSSDSDGAVGKAIIAGLDKAQNKRGAPVIPTTIVGTPQHAYINQPVAAAGSLAGASVGQVAYTSYGHPHFHNQAGAISGSATLNAGGHQQHLVQQSGAAAVAAPQAVFHKINYVAPNSALKVATFSAAPAHYEYGPAVAPTLTKYNYAAAVPQQYQYAHYPQQTIQVYQHHHPHQAPATIITNAAGQLQYLLHPQQQAATIYTAHQPAAAVHYTLTQPAVQQSVSQQAQAGTIHYHHAHQPQHPQQTTFVGVQPSVPVVHQAPIAAINQVHQANQVIAAQAQLVKYPLPTASPIYATNAVQNHLYQQQSANYGDPDTLTNFGTNTDAPQENDINGYKFGKGFKPYNRKTDIKPIVEYEIDRDEDRPQEETEEPCETEFKPDKKQSSFNRNLYNLFRTYEVASALLKASNDQKAKEDKQKKNKKTDDDNGDRIQLIHPPSEGDKKLKPSKGKSNERKYHYYYDHDHDHYHHYDHDDGKQYGKHSYRRNLD